MKFDLPPIEACDEDLLSYQEVRDIFRWKDNRTVRSHCKAGLLRRVRTSNSINGWRITASSAKALRTLMLSNSEEADYLEKARMQSMRDRKGQDQPKQQEVLLDSEDIIRRFNEGRQAPLLDSSPDTGSTYQPPQRTPRLGFTRIRGI